MTKVVRVAVVAGVILAAAVLEAGLPAAGGPAKDQVTLRLGWVAKGEYAFLYLGKEKGIFDRYNLQVEILEGRGSSAAIQAVATKNDTFGYTGGPSYLVARSRGVPVRMVALLLQKGPQVLLSWPDAPVRKPKDLEGKTMILSPGEAFASLWDAFAAGNGIDPTKVRIVSVGPDAKAQVFLARRGDVTPEFVTSAVFPIEERAGRELVKLSLADIGWDTISNGVLAHEDTIRDQPDLVRRFVAAAIEAFQATARDIDTAVVLMEPRLGGQSRAVIRKQIEATVQLAHTRRTMGKPVGWSSPEDWKDSLTLMAKGRQLKTLELRGVFYYYTNEFIPPAR